MTDLEFTGEFAIPGSTPAETLGEHLGRYAFASRRVAARRVLDMACGTGYGTRMLRDAGAASVVGIDLSANALGVACARYGAPGVHFVQGDATQVPLAPESVDVVVSFETIEHLPDPARYLAECHRVLRRGGAFICSSPNKRVYSWGLARPINPYHVREFTVRQFQSALRVVFGGPMEVFAQRTMGLRARLAYEVINLDRRLPVAARAVARLRAADDPDPRRDGGVAAAVDVDPRYEVGPFRSTLGRPATFVVAVCTRD